HYRHANDGGERSGVDRLLRFVAHVETDGKGDLVLRELQRKEERAAEVADVGDLDDVGARILEQQVARDALVRGLRRQPVRAGRIDYFAQLAAEFRGRGGDLHGRAGVV